MDPARRAEHRAAAATRADLRPPEPTGPVRVAEVTASGGVVRLSGSTDRDVEIALVGPRSRTAWRPASRTGEAFEVELDVFGDEWGVGRTSLPADRYDVVARTADGRTLDVAPERSLWRRLPLFVEDSHLHFVPHVSLEGALALRVVPAEWRTSRPPYMRRRLRDEVYPRRAPSRCSTWCCSRRSPARPRGTIPARCAASWPAATRTSTWSSASWTTPWRCPRAPAR